MKNLMSSGKILFYINELIVLFDNEFKDREMIEIF